MEHWWNVTDRQPNWAYLGKKLVSVTFGPPRISRRLTWSWTSPHRCEKPAANLPEAWPGPVMRNCRLINELLIYPMECELPVIVRVRKSFTLILMCVSNQGELFTFPHLSNPQLLEGSTVLIPPFWSAPSTTLKTNLDLLHAATAQLLCAMHPFRLTRALLNPP